MDINTKEIVEKSKQSLILLAEQLNKVEIVPLHDFELVSSQFRTGFSFEKALHFISKTDVPIVYIISLSDNVKRKELIKNFELFSVTNKEKNKDRINHSKYNKRDSEILYVGSSNSDFKSRLKDHLGVKGNTSTYAMHLSKWDNALYYNIKISTYKVVFFEGIKRTMVEIIEQQIWDQLQPVFGKRSGLL